MARLNYLDGAKHDLNTILKYVTRESGSFTLAQQFVARLRDKCRHLAGLPGSMGRPRPDLGNGVRSFAFRGYLIIFRYVENTMVIINIFEGHRDTESHLGELEE